MTGFIGPYGMFSPRRMKRKRERRMEDVQQRFLFLHNQRFYVLSKLDAWLIAQALDRA